MLTLGKFTAHSLLFPLVFNHLTRASVGRPSRWVALKSKVWVTSAQSWLAMSVLPAVCRWLTTVLRLPAP